MAMNKVPTLLVGIGGIGSQIVSDVNTLISEEDRRYVGLVCMDTNVSDLSKLTAKDLKVIQTSDDRLVKQYLTEHPEYTSWFPVNKFLVMRGMLQGAGQVRTISRLAALASQEAGRFKTLKDEIDRIRRTRDDGGAGNMTVMIVGSITGGTGAGMFLQLPYYIRRILKETAGIDSIVIRGMFIGPDITAKEQPSPVNAKAVRVNAYACLKELNAFYLAQSQDDKENHLELEHYEKQSQEEREQAARQLLDDASRRTTEDMFADIDDTQRLESDAAIIAGDRSNIPYDYLYLIEGSDNTGGIGNASIPTVIHQVARMVFTLMFTPVMDNALSVEDNMVLGAMAHNGMNRYASAGLIRMIYPIEQTREYVTLSSIRDLVGSEWLVIDREYENSVKQAMSLQRTDATIEIPKLQAEYPKLFEEQTKPGRGGSLGQLYREAFAEDEETHKPISRAVLFAKKVEELVGEILEDDEVVEKQEACVLERTKMTNFDDARIAINAVTTGLEEYESFAKQLVMRARFRAANAMFPPSRDTLDAGKKKEESIYQLLSGVHPVTARYLIFSLMNELEKMKAELEGSLSLEHEDTDFDPKTPGQQSAATALDIIQQKSKPIIGEAFDKKKLQWLAIMVAQDAEEHEEEITTYLRDSLIVATCTTLLERLGALAENYNQFFHGIEEKIKENNDRIQMLENSYRDNPLGQMGIYCSQAAFRNIYAEYRMRGEAQIPENMKSEVFLQLYDLVALEFENEGKHLTDVQKEREAELKSRKLEAIFSSAVEKTILEHVRKGGAGVVDMNIRQALAKQLTLETGMSPENTKDFDKQLSLYIREQVEKAMYLAAPMLSVDSSTKAENTESVYLALHPSCARFVNGAPDKGATIEDYVILTSPSLDEKRPTLLMDEEFKPNEIVCFKTRYLFLIENLTKYHIGSENELAYRERIANLNRVPDSSDPSVQNTVVNPHLNRYWHEEAFLPPIEPSERTRSIRNRKKAFLYAMGLDLFKRDKDEYYDNRIIWSLYYRNRWVPVFAEGNLIGNSYADLYQALAYNGRVKDYILKTASGYMKGLKGFADADEILPVIMDNELIGDWTQVTPERVSAAASVLDQDTASAVSALFPSRTAPAADFSLRSDENILDVLSSMRSHMEKEEWLSLFDALREALLEFLNYMLDRNTPRVRDAYVRIIEIMYANSAGGRRELKGEPMTQTEAVIREQINIMHDNF